MGRHGLCLARARTRALRPHSARALALALLLSACGSGQTFGCGSKSKSALLPGDDSIKVQVGDTAITQYDVTRAMETSIGEQAALSPEVEDKVLDSLITSRALALARERELDDRDRAALEKGVQRYREQLLVEQYVAQHYPLKLISREEIEAYYKEHASTFGARNVRNFELLTRSLENLPPSESREGVLTQLSSMASTPDWKASAAKSAADPKTRVDHQTGTANDQVLHPRVRHALATLTPGVASPPLIIEQRVYVLKVTGESKTDPRPLPEVSDSIRKTLAARALRESVAKASADVRKTTRIDYPKQK